MKYSLVLGASRNFHNFLFKRTMGDLKSYELFTKKTFRHIKSSTTLLFIYFINDGSLFFVVAASSRNLTNSRTVKNTLTVCLFCNRHKANLWHKNTNS
jgi:hypothetical protein